MIFCTISCRTTSLYVRNTRAIPSTPSSTSSACTRPLFLSRGRSIWVISPVTTTLEPSPNRVRNIFICSTVQFCASSSIIYASFRVRPRMYARGATSITPRSLSAWKFSLPRKSYSASYSGLRYGSTLFCRSPGKNPSFSPASTAGRVRIIFSTSLFLYASTAMATAR